MNTCLEFHSVLLIAAVVAIQLVLSQNWLNLDFQNSGAHIVDAHRFVANFDEYHSNAKRLYASAVCEIFPCDCAEFIYTAKIRSRAPAKLMSGREQNYIRRHLHSSASFTPWRDENSLLEWKRRRTGHSARRKSQNTWLRVRSDCA